jgi:magnesium transporter
MIKNSKRKTPNQKRSIKAGMSPGTPVFIGEKRLDKVRIDVLDYSETAVEHRQDVAADGLLLPPPGNGVAWISVKGVHDAAPITALGKIYGIHLLTLEDIINTTQRPKIEEYAGYIFIALKTMHYNEGETTLEIEHVSLLLGDNFVISFEEGESDLFGKIRERILAAKGRVRSMRADYLAYALMDVVVDRYFLVVERIGDRIEEIDERLLVEQKAGDVTEIHRIKRDILHLRRAVWPLREEVGALSQSVSELVGADTKVFFRDLHDHIIQVMDIIETSRDILGGMHDTYLTTISNRMNETMKILTIISTFFIPLTFIVGVYGMNFDNMPELHWRWGYLLIWAIMVTIVFAMIWFFKRKKWL